MNSPLISIIVPVYNASKYLRKCLDSILNQSFENYELILVNDGSKDDSGKICDDYKNNDDRIVVIHKKNEGVSVARNTGIQNSRAPWICFIDSDDWVDEKYLSSFVDAINDETEYISQGIMRDFTDGRPSFSFFEYDSVDIELNDDRIALYRVLHNGVPYAKLFKKELLDRHSLSFDKRISFHEDHVFVLKYLSIVKNIQLLSNISYHYIYWGTGSLSTKYNEPEELIISSDELIKSIEELRPKLSDKLDRYLESLEFSYGIYQLICACKNVKRNNYKEIFISCNKRFKQIDISKESDTWIYQYIRSCVNHSCLYFYLFIQLRIIRFIKSRRAS